MGDEFNGDKKSRLDGIEELLRVLVNEHIQFHEEHRQFHEEHRQLLKAQVVLNDSLQKLTEGQRRTDEQLALLTQHSDEQLTLLKAAQQAADERLAALIVTVDDLVRRPPQHN